MSELVKQILKEITAYELSNHLNTILKLTDFLKNSLMFYVAKIAAKIPEDTAKVIIES